MNKIKWLVRRELWEHKSLFIWAPILIAVAVNALFFGALLWNGPEKFFGISGAVTQEKMSLFFIESFEFLNILLLFVSGLFSTYYLLGALHSDRTDRSILFWKSLPVSDTQTVFSKLIFPLILAPLICLAAACVCFLIGTFALCVVLFFKDMNLFSTLFLNTNFILLPWRYISLLPIYILWALPTAGWLLMMSAWAKTRVAPWAIGLPILVQISVELIQKYLQLDWNTAWFAQHYIARTLSGMLPGMWATEIKNLGFLNIQSISAQGWTSLYGMSMWMGVLAGVAMLYMAVRLRRYRVEN